MKLTIIPKDSSVYINDIAFSDLAWSGTPSDVHALQWHSDSGWIEYTDLRNEVITALPEWAHSAIAAWKEAEYLYHNPPPDPPNSAEQNKIVASSLLADTDWTTIPDVADPTKSNPYLTNSNEFIAYRNAIRQIAINPVDGDIDWMPKPKAIWSST